MSLFATFPKSSLKRPSSPSSTSISTKLWLPNPTITIAQGNSEAATISDFVSRISWISPSVSTKSMLNICWLKEEACEDLINSLRIGANKVGPLNLISCKWLRYYWSSYCRPLISGSRMLPFKGKQSLSLSFSSLVRLCAQMYWGEPPKPKVGIILSES